MRFLMVKFQTFIPIHKKLPIIRRGIHSQPEAYVTLIQTYRRSRSLRRGRVLHAHLVTAGLALTPKIATNLVSFYSESGNASDARKVFDEMPKRYIGSWIVMIAAYTRQGRYQEALDMFSIMQREGVKPDRFVIPSVLKACSHLLDEETGKKLHCVILKESFETDAFVTSALIDTYAKCRKIQKARRVFDSLVEKDLVVFNSMVSGLAHNGEAEEAWGLVEKMKGFGLNPDMITWNALILGFSLTGDREMVSEIFSLMLRNGIKPDIVSWTSAVSGHVQNFQNDEAFDCFREMLNHGVSPNSATISALLPACANIANVRLGKEMHGYSVMMGVEDDVYVRSALVDMYAKCGFISEARVLFNKMPQKNTITFNSMIFGYANNGYSDEAIEVFKEMDKEGKKPDHLTFTAVFLACSHAGLTDLGQKLFYVMQDEYKIVPRLEHYACMVDLLGRAGKVEEAYGMIKEMPIEPDSYVWGALLGACRNHGYIDLGEIAAKRLQELEPESPASDMMLLGLYADAGKWGNVVRLKKKVKRNRQKRFLGCSWIETA